MALNKLKYNSLNLTPAANKAIGFDSDADALYMELQMMKVFYLIYLQIVAVIIMLLRLQLVLKHIILKTIQPELLVM
jgi:hypothetical protein